jgi:hypothetical protein
VIDGEHVSSRPGQPTPAPFQRSTELNIELIDHECNECRYIGYIFLPTSEMPESIYSCNGRIFTRGKQNAEDEKTQN